jgi:hypothetical protein
MGGAVWSSTKAQKSRKPSMIPDYAPQITVKIEEAMSGSISWKVPPTPTALQTPNSPSKSLVDKRLFTDLELSLVKKVINDGQVYFHGKY